MHSEAESAWSDKACIDREVDAWIDDTCFPAFFVEERVHNPGRSCKREKRVTEESCGKWVKDTCEHLGAVVDRIG